jgi:hypothetical protein
MSVASEAEMDEALCRVTTLLGTATVETLEEAFGEIQLQIPPSATGKKSMLLRTLNRHLNSDTVVNEADQGFAVLKQVIAVCEKGLLKDQATSGTGVTGKGETAGKSIKTEPKEEKVGVSATAASLNMSKLKDFKLNGTVGGDKPIPYSSLVFQIENAQHSGFEDGPICFESNSPGIFENIFGIEERSNCRFIIGTVESELCHSWKGVPVPPQKFHAPPVSRSPP